MTNMLPSHDYRLSWVLLVVNSSDALPWPSRTRVTPTSCLPMLKQPLLVEY